MLRAGDRQSPVGSRVTIFLRLRVSRRLHLLGLTPTPCDSHVLFADLFETGLMAKWVKLDSKSKRGLWENILYLISAVFKIYGGK